MEELLELKDCLSNRQYDRAFAIVEELEAMGRQDKINNLESFLVVLLIHLIKIQVEKRVTRSWKNSMINSLLAIQKRNKLGKKSLAGARSLAPCVGAGSHHYIKPQNWDEHIKECQFEAILGAAKEVFEGIDYQELENLLSASQLMTSANKLLQLTYDNSPREIVEIVNSKFASDRL